jgi:hypothetical protein
MYLVTSNTDNVFSLIDPNLPKEPERLQPPARPLPSAVSFGARSLIELSAHERDMFRLLLGDYEMYLAEYESKRSALSEFKEYVLSTITREHLPCIVKRDA